MDIKFEKLITEMEKLIVTTAPQLQKTINVLKNNETCDFEEIEKKEAELNTLRKKYVQIASDLIELGSRKASLKIKEIIQMRRDLDKNYARDLREANQGKWKSEFFDNLPF